MIFDREIDDGVFAFTVVDDAMAPLITAGMTIHFASDMDPVNGDFVIVKLKRKILIREFQKKNKKVILKARNTAFDSYQCLESDLRTKSTGIYPILRVCQDFSAATRAQTLNSEKLLTFHETMRALKVGRTKMYQLLRSGELSASKVGKLWRIPKQAIDEYLKQCKTEKYVEL